MSRTPYTYLFIRTDLSTPQQIVQASHAALEAGYKFGQHSHLICFGIKSESYLQKLLITLQNMMLNFRYSLNLIMVLDIHQFVQNHL